MKIDYNKLSAEVEKSVKTSLTDKDGRFHFTDVYISRYYAKKANDGTKKVVKVDGGYMLMDYDEYRTWRNQK